MESQILHSPRGLRAADLPMVDATHIHAPSSIKYQEQGRDPEMYQTKKGEAMVLWHEGACWSRHGFRGGAHG